MLWLCRGRGWRRRGRHLRKSPRQATPVSPEPPPSKTRRVNNILIQNVQLSNVLIRHNLSFVVSRAGARAVAAGVVLVSCPPEGSRARFSDWCGRPPPADPCLRPPACPHVGPAHGVQAGSGPPPVTAIAADWAYSFGGGGPFAAALRRTCLRPVGGLLLTGARLRSVAMACALVARLASPENAGRASLES